MNFLEALKGKKTYATILMGLIYVAGAYFQWWAFDERIASAFGLGAIATLRAGVATAPTTKDTQ
ncbi:MAG TPA: hypothetical protein PKI20_13550 [Verrucomicrobiota bacterium]|nr:hypothetical protein [Verrucomicrobiota bacterium]HQL78702.1 hypothetical protein [Verrucomicrobiota bacterium]